VSELSSHRSTFHRRQALWAISDLRAELRKPGLSEKRREQIERQLPIYEQWLERHPAQKDDVA
jgi:hypothetical protein